MKINPPHIHEAHDGRPPRDVYLNSKLIKQCFYADERKGIVRQFRQPLKLDKYRKRVLSRTLRGDVVVVLCGAAA